jgi:hypothetical protein
MNKTQRRKISRFLINRSQYMKTYKGKVFPNLEFNKSYRELEEEQVDYFSHEYNDQDQVIHQKPI